MEHEPLLPPAGHPDFPVKLKALREQAGLSGAELSRRAGIAPTMVPRYESTTRDDRHVPRPNTVKSLERELRLALCTAKGNEASVGDGRSQMTATEKHLSGFSLDELVNEIKGRGYKVTLATID